MIIYVFISVDFYESWTTKLLQIACAFFFCVFFLTEKEVNLDSFELEAPSEVTTQESMKATCKIRMPADWESQATARVSVSFKTLGS